MLNLISLILIKEKYKYNIYNKKFFNKSKFIDINSNSISF